MRSPVKGPLTELHFSGVRNAFTHNGHTGRHLRATRTSAGHRRSNQTADHPRVDQ